MSSWPRCIVFVRHGESEGNVMHKDDLPIAKQANHLFSLTDRGREQAQSVGRYLRFHPLFGRFDAHYVSTYRRTHETMRDLLGADSSTVGISIREDARLDEWWKGVWYELPEAEVHTRYPYETAVRARSGPYHYRPLGGESGADVECRIRAFLTDLRLNHSGCRVLVAAHGRWLQFLRKVVLGLTSDQLDTKQLIRNCSLTICKPDRTGSGLTFEEFGSIPDAVRTSHPALWE